MYVLCAPYAFDGGNAKQIQLAHTPKSYFIAIFLTVYFQWWFMFLCSVDATYFVQFYLRILPKGLRQGDESKHKAKHLDQITTILNGLSNDFIKQRKNAKASQHQHMSRNCFIDVIPFTLHFASKWLGDDNARAVMKPFQKL